MELINYALVFENIDGETVLVKNDGTQADISEKPFYKTRENAEKAIKKIMKAIQRYNEGVRLYWYEKAINGELNEDAQPSGERFIKDFEDGELILKNGLRIVEVKITIDI